LLLVLGEGPRRVVVNHEPYEYAGRRGDPKKEQNKRKVHRLSPARLLRQKLDLPGGITLSAERHRGRLVVRVEVPKES
jgi:hypothetical protein